MNTPSALDKLIQWARLSDDRNRYLFDLRNGGWTLADIGRVAHLDPSTICRATAGITQGTGAGNNTAAAQLLTWRQLDYRRGELITAACNQGNTINDIADATGMAVTTLYRLRADYLKRRGRAAAHARAVEKAFA